MGRGQVLDHDKRHAGGGRERLEKFGQRLQAARRGAEPYNGDRFLGGVIVQITLRLGRDSPLSLPQSRFLSVGQRLVDVARLLGIAADFAASPSFPH